MSGSVRPVSSDAVPEAEIELFRQHIHAHAEYCDPEYVIGAYEDAGLTVLPDPFSAAVLDPIIEALRKENPLSVIRIGDGEVSLLAHDSYVGTPSLDRYALLATIALMKDSFEVSELWMSVLRDLMLAAVWEADLIGCRGLSRSVQRMSSVADFIRVLSRDLRGGVGVFRSIEFMLRLSRQKMLREKIVCSAHLYFSVLDHLSTLLQHASRVLCISSESSAVEKLRKTYPTIQIDHIPVGTNGQSSARTEPVFLREVETSLPRDLRGSLCLVGAGVWAEIYCTWIKRRGGVGVDIGSGFDLLAGRTTRPAHKEALGELRKDYLSKPHRL